jgi:hypothetical protein
MAPTAAQLAQVRRMVAEPITSTIYFDPDITAYIVKYPLLDERGEEPYAFDGATPPAQVANASWIPTYDLNAAAADIWEEKAAGVATGVNFSADGGNYQMSNQYEQFMKMARHFRARRAVKSLRSYKSPKEYPATDTRSDIPWIENMPEPRDVDGDDVYII